VKLRAHKTKIVATIGPACRWPELLTKLIEVGMDIARLNLSHGDVDEHLETIKALRAAESASGRKIAILADFPGPKIRIGHITGETVDLVPGSMFTLTTREIVGDRTRAFVSLAQLPALVKAGDHIFINDGIVQLEVERANREEVACRVVVGGQISSRKGVNLPGLALGISAFTEQDKSWLEFAAKQGIDVVSQSFVESAADIAAVRSAAASIGYRPFIIAKIERARALDAIDEIIAAADGVMVARGDLGVEVPIERIAVLQKQLIDKALRAGKPVIVATQMLESMTRSRQPTRAEATDVANAILDGADCVMLSAESASGRYPVEAVATLARIAAATEPYRPRFELFDRLRAMPSKAGLDRYDLVALAAEAVMMVADPAVVAVSTMAGRMARSIARFRLQVWIAAITENAATARELLLTYGVQPVFVEHAVGDWNAYVRDWMTANGIARSDIALLLKGPLPDQPSLNHALEVIEIEPPTSSRPS
jgi:pyruvate kinase